MMRGKKVAEPLIGIPREKTIRAVMNAIARRLKRDKTLTTREFRSLLRSQEYWNEQLRLQGISLLEQRIANKKKAAEDGVKR
jgi:hypothetical protein